MTDLVDLTEDEVQSLSELRERIDEIDETLVHLFDQRAELVLKVGEWKKAHSIGIHDPNRENQILEKVIKTSRSYLKDSEIQTLFSKMIEFFRVTEKARSRISSAQEGQTLPVKGVLGFFGFGLIGASVGLALQEQFPDYKFLVYDPYLVTDDFESWNLSRAKSAFKVVNIHELVNVDYLFLAAPIDSNSEFGPHLAEKNRVTLNLGSYQENIKNVVGFHPLAGRERAGYHAATADLFYGKTICLSNTEMISPAILEELKCLAHSMGAEVLLTSHENHNRSLAYSSHLVQLLSMALGFTLEDKGFDQQSHLIPSSGKDLLRLNGSDLKMWEPILRKNKNYVLTAIEDFQKGLNGIKKAIANSAGEKPDSDEIKNLFLRAQRIYKNIYERIAK